MILGFILVRAWANSTPGKQVHRNVYIYALSYCWHFSFYNSITARSSPGTYTHLSLSLQYRVFYFRSIASWFTIAFNISSICALSQKVSLREKFVERKQNEFHFATWGSAYSRRFFPRSDEFKFYSKAILYLLMNESFFVIAACEWFENKPSQTEFRAASPQFARLNPIRKFHSFGKSVGVCVYIVCLANVVSNSFAAANSRMYASARGGSR